MDQIVRLSSRKEYLAISPVDVRTEAFPMLLPHRYSAILLMSYLNVQIADRAEQHMREVLGREGFQWKLEQISDRPPMKERKGSIRLAQALSEVAEEWEIPFARESSLWPSVAGLVPASVPVVCGVGPVAQDLYTPQESIQRIGLLQRTLLIAQFLIRDVRG
jgi:D-alanine-D-alanine ligase